MKALTKCTAFLLALIFVFCLNACGKAETTDTSAAQEQETQTTAETTTQSGKPEIAWQSYHLTVEKIRSYDGETDDESDLPEAQDGEEYVIAEVRCGEEEEIPSDVWSGLNSIYMKTPSGGEYKAEKISQSGIAAIRYDVMYITSSCTLSFYYLVPEGTPLSDLSLFVKDTD